MNIYDLWLYNTKVSNKLKLQLIFEFKSSECLWYHIMQKNTGHFENYVSILKKSWNIEELKKIQEKIYKCNIDVSVIYDDKYPSKLRYCSDPPFMLFYKGNINKLNIGKCIGVVGSRKPTYYGKNATLAIVKDLSIYGINIISGMARGIDTMAHRGCLDNGGFTCAVLGCGVDVVYPKENQKIYEEIIEKGCIISEYMPGTIPISYNFPIRNRIISGLSDIIIVIEASYKSGSLITAGYALEQGKDVMALPGSIFSDMSKGTNKLIKDGAYPITDIVDIFDLLNIDYKKDKCHDITLHCDKKELALLNIIQDTPIHIDDIIKIANIDIKQLYELLFELQLKNKITCLAGNYYIKNGTLS